MKSGEVLESPEEVLPTMDTEGKRRWIYPKVAKGRFFRFRRYVGILLIGLYVIVPFVKINGKPLLMLDLINREFIVFGKVFLATDTVLFLLLIISIGILIIGATAILGRVWCGWACPQTVYLEFVFRPIEALIEGSVSKRRKRDQAGASWDKFWRKSLKYFIYLVISSVLANAFLAYFIGSDKLLQWMQLSPLLHPVPFGIMTFVTALVMFDFTYFREQMCTIACPYARLQSVLLDKNSVIVGYDTERGEPRGKGKDRDSYGDCIDCHQCVEVCPTGIDIRKGLQMECIHCAQCIDVCDEVMRKVGSPQGLIRYSSLSQFRGGVLKVFRPRTYLYAAGLVLFIAMFTYGVITRADSSAQILRAHEEPYTILDNGNISNHLQVKIVNSSSLEDHYLIEVVSEQDLTAVVPISEFELDSREQTVLNVFLNFPNDSEIGRARISISSENGFSKELLYQLQKP